MWLVLAFALAAVAFHFLNVLKDIEEDQLQGILGLPQRVGKRPSQIIAIVLLLIATADIIFLH